MKRLHQRLLIILIIMLGSISLAVAVRAIEIVPADEHKNFLPIIIAESTTAVTPTTSLTGTADGSATVTSTASASASVTTTEIAPSPTLTVPSGSATATGTGTASSPTFTNTASSTPTGTIPTATSSSTPSPTGTIGCTSGSPTITTTPSATATSTPEAPQIGQWHGRTNQCREVTFYVLNDNPPTEEPLLFERYFSVEIVFPGCIRPILLQLPAVISNNQFEITDSTSNSVYQLRGRFTSATAAQGTLVFQNTAGACNNSGIEVSWSAFWQDASSPTNTPVIAIKP